MPRGPVLAVLAAVATALATALPAAADTPHVVLLPAATFAHRADAICTQENVKRARGPQVASFSPATATKAQIRAAGKVLMYSYPIGVDEIRRISQIGAPREKLAHAAWTRLRTLLVHTAFPAIHQLAQTGVDGKVSAFRTQFSALEAITRQEQAYAGSLGFTVCGR